MMRVNPFTYGNPISDQPHFFGRKHEVEQIFSRLRNVEFESSSIVGERRIGKTSLLHFLMHPEVRRAYGLAQEKYLFIYMDLQIVEKDTTPLRLWQRLLRQMNRSCHDVEIRYKLKKVSEASYIDNFAIIDLFDSIDEKGLYVVLLLDEFENIIDNQNFDAAFFYGLRALAIHHKLSLITSSRRELIDLCHSESIRSSPFFNIFANIALHPFNEEDARTLIKQLLTETDTNFANEEITFILHNTGFHPYFLQIACHFLFEAYAQDLTKDGRIQYTNKMFRKEASSHFHDYWHNCYEQEKIALTVLALLERQQKKAGGRTFHLDQLRTLCVRSELVFDHLEKRGLLVAEASTYTLFATSFGDWICHEITNILHDQQAYKDWLQSNRNKLEHLSTKARRDLGQILPRISDRYRELIVDWVSDPKNVMLIAGLLRTALGIGQNSFWR